MQELRFDDDIRFTATVSSDQTWLHRALGAHELRLQLAVGVSPFTGAGKILALEADLFGFEATGQRSRLARTTANLAYTPKITVHRRGGDAVGDDRRTPAERAHHQCVTTPTPAPRPKTRTAWQSSTTASQAPTSSTTDCPPCTGRTRICR